MIARPLLIEMSPSFQAVPASTYLTVPWVGSSHDQKSQWSKKLLPDQFSTSVQSELNDEEEEVAAGEEEVVEVDDAVAQASDDDEETDSAVEVVDAVAQASDADEETDPVVAMRFPSCNVAVPVEEEEVEVTEAVELAPPTNPV